MEGSRPKRTRFLIVAVAMCVILACGFILSGCSAGPLGQSAEKFKQAFLEDAIVQNGIAGNQYVKDSAYEIKEFEIGDIEQTSDTEVFAPFNAKIENANFITDVSGTATYTQMRGTDGGYYVFECDSSETTPKKGIDFDEGRKLEDVEAILSDDGKSCSVEVIKDYEFWFVDSEVKTVYSYEFTGQNRWEYKGDDKQHTTVYKDIDGTYAANSGDLTDLAAFEVSNLNAEKGTFDIAYTSKETSIPVGISRTRVYPEIHGTLTATFDPIYDDKDKMEDGYSYRFEAKGTTDQGADKTVYITGYFTVNSNNELGISISRFSQATDYYSEYSGDLLTNNDVSMGTGFLIKQ